VNRGLTFLHRGSHEITLTVPLKAAFLFLYTFHPKLTRERSIRFFLFDIKRVFVYISTIFKLMDLFILYFLIQNVYANKKYLRKKAVKLCIRG